MPGFRLPTLRTAALALALLAACSGCRDQPAEPAYVARVGNAVLMPEQLDAALADLPPRQDSTEVRRQLVDQWVTNELLYQEALRHNLAADADVQRRLDESQRSVLIDALVSRLYQETIETVSPVELHAYYERHKEQLRLREPFVRVRYLACTAPDSARAVRNRILRSSFRAAADSLWPALARRYADDVDGALALADNYFPENRLFAQEPALRDHLARLKPGQTAPVINTNGHWHVLQLADRVPAGTVPELPWIEEEVRRLLTIDARKQMYERQVERLRTEARARDALDVR